METNVITLNERPNTTTPPKRIIMNITIDLISKNGHQPIICKEVPRILREYADIESSPFGARQKVETYNDEYGNKLTSVVALDYGHEIPYARENLDG